MNAAVLPLYAIAVDGPAAGQVYEVPATQLAVTLLCDDGTHRYRRRRVMAPGVRLACYEYVDTLVT